MNWRSFQRELVDCFGGAGAELVEVDFGSFDWWVGHQVAQGVYVCSLVDLQSGEGVAEAVEGERLRDASIS